MSILINIAISIATLALATFGIANYVPASWFGFEDMKLGTSVTSLNSTDNLSDFPTTYNANLTAINAGKMEISTTTLPLITTLTNLTTIGTIGTGVWNATPIPVGYGGTGTTSPSQYQVLLGNGASGLTVASSTGTSGQFLTSNGAGDYPSWQTSSIDESLDYNWTGEHDFSATTTIQGTVGGLMPAGAITAYASSTPPTGWLTCDGTAVSRNTYYSLFSVIGTTYGVGDGSTTFNLPNLAGKQIMMASTTANMGQSGGESNHLLLSTESGVPAHTHPYGGGVTGAITGLNASAQNNRIDDATVNANAVADASKSHNVLDPYLTTWYMIKY